MHVNLRAISLAAAYDPKAALLEAAGSVDDFEPFHNQVLVATYIKPPKIMRGPNGEEIIFHDTDRALEEERFQGKPALVLKVGPLAFLEQAPHYMFGGLTIKPGDWVVVRPSDGLEMFMGSPKASNGASVRLFSDVNILARVADPSTIY